MEGTTHQTGATLDHVNDFRQFGGLDAAWAGSNCFSSIQYSFVASHVSRVKAVRTMRALLRPDSMQDMTLDGFDLSRSM